MLVGVVVSQVVQPAKSSTDDPEVTSSGS
jgi:hypothetical protein